MGIYFDDQGLVVDDIDTVKQQMIDRANILFAPYLNGTTLKTNDSSVLGRIFSIVSVPAVQNSLILPSWISSIDPNQAEGLALDWLVNTANMKRLPASQADGMVMLFGDVGVTIPENTRVANQRTGDVFTTNNETFIDEINANGIELEINSISSPILINYTINGYLSESPPIQITLGSNDTTVEAVANRIIDAVNTQSSYLVATKNNDNSVKVVIENQNNNGDFSTSSNLTIVRAYKQCRITSETYASDEADENTITVRKNTVVGFRGVTNPFKVFASQPIEDDERLRYRFKLNKGSGNVSSFNSILFSINSVEGVTFSNIQQNTTANTSGSGITNNGLAITVQGGNEDEVALAIFDSISAGIETVGDIEKSVSDINGGSHIIRFSRPKLVPIEISMSLTVYPDFPVGGQIAIKQAIVEYFNKLSVGEDIHYSRLYEPINSIRGFSVRNLKINRLGQTLLTEDIIIGYNEIATISHENIKIGGN